MTDPTRITAADYAAIKAELADPVYADALAAAAVPPNNYAPVCRLLLDRSGTKPNPVAQPSVPKPLDPIAMMALIDDARWSAIDAASKQTLAASIEAQNVPAFQVAVLSIHKGGMITDTEKDAVLAESAATVPDPKWPATVPDDSNIEKAVGRSPIHCLTDKQVVEALAS